MNQFPKEHHNFTYTCVHVHNKNLTHVSEKRNQVALNQNICIYPDNQD